MLSHAPTAVSGTSPFSSNSVLVVVADGITEARRYDADEPCFFGSNGVARAYAVARRTRQDPARAISEAAVRHANRVIRDDATLLSSAET